MVRSEITVITVCRNAASTISRTIESVLEHKKTRPIEYIVIDGDSSDDTQQIVRSFGNLIDVFISEPDNGVSDAFNKGILLATGEIIALINADDYLLPGALDRVCEYFELNPRVDVLHGDVLLGEGGRIIKRMKPAGRWWYPWRLVLFNHPATFVRRHVYHKYGLFDTSLQIAMDVEMYLRWQRSEVVIEYLPIPLSAMESGGLSDQAAHRGFNEVRQCFLRYKYPWLVVNLLYLSKIAINAYVNVCRARKSQHRIRK